MTNLEKMKLLQHFTRRMETLIPDHQERAEIAQLLAADMTELAEKAAEAEPFADELPGVRKHNS